MSHHQEGRLADAEKAYRKLLKLEAAHADGVRLLGGLYLQTGEWAKAAEYLEKAARLKPGNAEILTNWGLALRGLGQSDQAIELYRNALAVQPDYRSALNNLAGLLHEKGKFAEALQLYGRVLQLDPHSPSAHYHYGNTLFVSGKIGEAIARYEHALKLKPDYLEAMINLGMALSQAGKSDLSRQWLGVAQSWFEKALAVDGNNIVALNNFANVLRQQGKPAEAVVYYRKALTLKPDYADASVNLATSLRDLGRYDEAIESCRQALRLRPESADARINLGALLQDLARHEEAIDFFTEALARKPASIDAQWNKSLSLLALGRYEEGFRLHEIGLGVTHMRGEYFAPRHRWQGQDFAGKRLLIWAEQGLGDSLQFIRYGALCKQRAGMDGKILVMCPRALRRLFSRCDFIDALPDNVEERDFDLHVPMMSLPFIFATSVETIPAQIPYLRIAPETRAAWAVKFGRRTGFRVGLVWAGNPRQQQMNAHMVDRRRSLSLEMLRPLFDVPGVEFYNLQMGAAAAHIDECGLRHRFTDLMRDVKDFEDTGAIVEQLDLVISVDTSVVHLVGGMGRPVWVLSRFDACWRWLQNRADSPWYPTARVFGQKAPGNWSAAIAELRGALEEAVIKMPS